MPLKLITCWKVGRFVQASVSLSSPVVKSMRSARASAHQVAGSEVCLAVSFALASVIAAHSDSRQASRPRPQ